jgi:cellulose synthase (UDP-forming)
LLTWIVLVQGLLWSGLALRMDEFGWHLYWATALLAAVQLYMLAPLMTPGKGVWGRAQEEPAEVAG